MFKFAWLWLTLTAPVLEWGEEQPSGLSVCRVLEGKEVECIPLEKFDRARQKARKEALKKLPKKGEI